MIQPHEKYQQNFGVSRKALRKEVGTMARQNTCAFILENLYKCHTIKIRLIWPKQSLKKKCKSY